MATRLPPDRATSRIPIHSAATADLRRATDRHLGHRLHGHRLGADPGVPGQVIAAFHGGRPSPVRRHGNAIRTRAWVRPATCGTWAMVPSWWGTSPTHTYVNNTPLDHTRTIIAHGHLRLRLHIDDDPHREHLSGAQRGVPGHTLLATVPERHGEPVEQQRAGQLELRTGPSAMEARPSLQSPGSAHLRHVGHLHDHLGGERQCSVCGYRDTSGRDHPALADRASFLGQGEGCAPLTVSFTNTSSARRAIPVELR